MLNKLVFSVSLNPIRELKFDIPSNINRKIKKAFKNAVLLLPFMKTVKSEPFNQCPFLTFIKKYLFSVSVREKCIRIRGQGNFQDTK